MATSVKSKYLQLSDEDASCIGKPSPLALLAATCRKIGTASPRTAARTPSPRPASGSTSDLLSAPVAKVPCHQLPPTPPPSPPYVSVSPAASPVGIDRSSPLPASTTCYTTQPPVCPPPHQPNSTHPAYRPTSVRYSPYTMIPARRSTRYPPVCSSPCCLGPQYLPYPAAYHQGSSICSSSYYPVPFTHVPVFGVYDQHQLRAPVASVSSMKTRPARRQPRKAAEQEDEEEIIDVVSL
ncbi:uncharacterized protein [Diadema setosum]|uniref:uncharacterized protein n=1 Tax=Diadema setosum TaxID=31175 RepID=UPI003B3BBD36